MSVFLTDPTAISVYKFTFPCQTAPECDGVNVGTAVPVAVTTDSTNYASQGPPQSSHVVGTDIRYISAGYDGTVIGAGPGAGVYSTSICSRGQAWIAKPAYSWSVVENDGLPPGYGASCTGVGTVRTRGGTFTIDPSGALVITYRAQDKNDMVCDITPGYLTTYAMNQTTTQDYSLALPSGAGSYSETFTAHDRTDTVATDPNLSGSYYGTDSTGSGSQSWPMESAQPPTWPNTGSTFVRSVPSTDPVPAECTAP